MNKDKIATIIVSIIVISIMIYGFLKEKELSENKVQIEGKIIDYYYVGAKTYIKYNFRVNDKKYFGEQRVYPFTCENGVNGCVGKTFEITYSAKEPNNNEIDLKEYNKFKPNRIRAFN